MTQGSLFSEGKGAQSGEAPFDAKTFFEKFAADHLTEYVAELRNRPGRPEGKEINDPVWQTISLTPFEVLLLDSPLFQRLRHIRQLGVAHYVYPGALHSRLDHSIGVLHQMQRLIDAINESARRRVVDGEHQRLMRVIALCHDIGHGVMSHVAENALSQYEEVQDLSLLLSDELELEKVRLSEVAAYFILRSRAFAELLSVAKARVPDHVLPESAQEMIADAIVGRTISDDIPLLNELISGPFDADKLDYMARDAHMAGVPVVTDTTRLVRKVRAQEVAHDKLPRDIARAVKERPSYTITGVALSGGRTLDELMLGRTLLFDKIYRHQKVRSVEAIVASQIRAIADAIGRHPMVVPYLVTDDELMFLDRSKLKSLCEASRKLDDECVAVVEDMACRLRTRKLFVRAFAFAQTMPRDPQRHSDVQKAGLETLIRESRDPEQRPEIVESIVEALREILAALDESEKLPSQATRYLGLDPPSGAPTGGDVPRAYLIDSHGDIMRFRDDAAETRGWADAYLLTHDIGYVFCPEPLAPYAWLACKQVVRNRYGIQMPDSMLSYAKQDPQRIRQLQRRLDSAGYYQGKPHDLRPMPERLLKADVRRSIEKSLERIGGYQGPIPQDQTVAKVQVGVDRAINWLRQFPSEKEIDQALEMLSSMELVGRATIVAAVKNFVSKNNEFEGSIVCPLGTIKDSAAIAAYYARDVKPETGLDTMLLPDALARSVDRPIILLDDFVGSGQQAVSIIENWLGVTPSTNLNEERSETLSPEIAEVLKRRKIGIVFAAGMASGPDHLRERCLELGLDVKVHVEKDAKQLPRAFANERWPELKKRCQHVGEQLLVDASPKKASERILGYGNQALLILFPYNTPTQTLTCLWKDGTVDGVPWSPLFPRRKKT